MGILPRSSTSWSSDEQVAEELASHFNAISLEFNELGDADFPQAIEESLRAQAN